MEGGGFILRETSRWRGRAVRYYGGAWDEVKSVLPKFELRDFVAEPGGEPNPFLKIVMRLPPDGITGSLVPLGLVSKSYGLVQHRELARHCLEGMHNANVSTSGVRCEIGLSQFDEWMNLRFYFPDEYSYTPQDGQALKLRVEIFNTVDGSGRLTLFLGWYRIVCSNGLVIGRSLIEIRDVHNAKIDLSRIQAAIAHGARLAEDDKKRMIVWQTTNIKQAKVEAWANGHLTKKWGKKAASRVFHICQSGHDVKWTEPFVPGAATEKAVQLLNRVRGAKAPAETMYDICQALSFVATHCNDAEARLKRQIEIPSLLRTLAA